MRFSALVVLLAASSLHSAPLVDFPAPNHTLGSGHPDEFFMGVDRTFEGKKSQPWQGGQFGYVRNPRRDGNGEIFYTRLHEGIDIRPLKRDAQGNPLDQVLAAAAGRVVHVSASPGASNYGRYIVIEHQWDGSRYYTLYAHLASTAVTPGETVRQGQPLGQLGFSGAGLNRERAHVHFEVGLLLSNNFESWHDAFFPASPNQHGLFNGLNLVGMDPAELLLAAKKDPNLHIADQIRREEPYFAIVINDSPNFSLIRNYPWLVPSGEVANPPAWKVTFSRSGLPLKVEAAKERISEPRAVWVKDTPYPTTAATKELLTGSASAPRLTDSGMRFARLLTWPD